MQITFLVGNGFDMATGLDTSYATFYKWYCQQPSLKKHIERFKKEIADDVKTGGKNWADFEIGLGQYTSRFTVDQVGKFLECYEDAHEMIVKFLELQKDAFDFEHISDEALTFFKNGLLKFYQDLSPQEIKIFEEMLDSDKINNSVINFLSFNYTDTLDRVVEELSKAPLKQCPIANGTRNMNVNKKIVHMHGTSTTYPVLGVDNETQIANQDFLSVPNFNEVLLKPQSVNAIGELWHSEAEELIFKSKIVGVFGMSIGESDAKWWNVILKWLKDNPTRRLIIFWYSKNPPNGISIYRKLEETQKAKTALCKHSALTPEEIKNISKRIHIAINTKNVLNLHLQRKNKVEDASVLRGDVVFSEEKNGWGLTASEKQKTAETELVAV